MVNLVLRRLLIQVLKTLKPKIEISGSLASLYNTVVSCDVFFSPVNYRLLKVPEESIFGHWKIPQTNYSLEVLVLLNKSGKFFTLEMVWRGFIFFHGWS